MGASGVEGDIAAGTTRMSVGGREGADVTTKGRQAADAESSPPGRDGDAAARERQMSTEPHSDYSQFSLDSDGRFLGAADDRLATRVGYGVAELVGQHYSTLLAEGQAESVQWWLDRVLAGERVGPVEVEVVRKGGDNIWIQFTATPRLEGERIVGVDCLAREVTEEVHARTELPRLRQLHESIVESIRVGILVVDSQKSIVAWNRHMEEWFQMGRQEAMGRRVTELFPKLTEEGLEEWLGVVMEGGEPFVLTRWCHESERRHATFHIDLSVVPLRCSDGDVLGALLLFEDVSDEVKLEAELRKSDQLATIAQTAAAVNHEINNPLATILGNAELLLRQCSDKSPTTVKRLKRIAEATGRMAEVTQKLAKIVDPVVTEWAPGMTMLDIERSAAPEK